MRVRADDDGRIPIPAQRRLALAFERLQHQFLPRRLVVANQNPVLRLGINRVGIDRVHLRPEAVAARGYEPVRIWNAGEIVRARRPAPGKVVLGPAAHVVERRCVVDGHVVELHRRQIGLELPFLGVVPGFVQAAVGAQQPVLGVLRIDPQRVVVHVMVDFVHAVQRLAAVERLAQKHVHHEDAVDVLRIGHDARVVHRSLIEFVALLPRCALIGRAENSALAVSRFNRRIHHVRILRRNRQPNAPHVHRRQPGFQLVPGRARVG